MDYAGVAPAVSEAVFETAFQKDAKVQEILKHL